MYQNNGMHVDYNFLAEENLKTLAIGTLLLLLLLDIFQERFQRLLHSF